MQIKFDPTKTLNGLKQIDAGNRTKNINFIYLTSDVSHLRDVHRIICRTPGVTPEEGFERLARFQEREETHHRLHYRIASNDNAYRMIKMLATRLTVTGLMGDEERENVNHAADHEFDQFNTRTNRVKRKYSHQRDYQSPER